MVVAMNEHDLEGAASLMHRDYRSEQPAHPSLAFIGRAHMRANWEAMFAGIPDFQAELCRSVNDGDTTWSECTGQAPGATVSPSRCEGWRYLRSMTVRSSLEGCTWRMSIARPSASRMSWRSEPVADLSVPRNSRTRRTHSRSCRTPLSGWCKRPTTLIRQRVPFDRGMRSACFDEPSWLAPTFSAPLLSWPTRCDRLLEEGVDIYTHWTNHPNVSNQRAILNLQFNNRVQVQL